jgi:uncharacterized protein involved in response to NO
MRCTPALALIVMIECVIAGRVMPAFTMSATPGLKLAARPALERATLSLTAFALRCWVFAPPAGSGDGSTARPWRWRRPHLAGSGQWQPG